MCFDSSDPYKKNVTRRVTSSSVRHSATRIAVLHIALHIVLQYTYILIVKR